MLGTGPLLAHIVFWILLGIGLAFGELRGRSAAILTALWAFGVFGLPRLTASGGLLTTTYVAVLDIVLTLIVFKGDVRLS